MTNTLTTNIKQLFQAFADVLMPRTCPVCNCVLSSSEPFVCRKCLQGLPTTLFERRQFNAMEQLFAGKTPIERAWGHFYYQKSSPYTKIIINTKYHNMPKMGTWFGHYTATIAAKHGCFDGIDLIIPVPMHHDKLASRGYNQADYIAKGISQASGIPIGHNIAAIKPHNTQTRKTILERWHNTQGLFSAVCPDELIGKHVLIVDDVVTTGATMLACAKAIENIADIKISLMSLAVSKLD